MIFPDRELPSSGQYAARLVMQKIIQALEKPENAAMVSIFVPGELLTAAEGFPETMCSYHRVFLGAALSAYEECKNEVTS